MKQLTQLGLVLIAITMFLSSCSVVGGIFKAGMGVGIFVVVVVIALILWLVSRGRR